MFVLFAEVFSVEIAESGGPVVLDAFVILGQLVDLRLLCLREELTDILFLQQLLIDRPTLHDLADLHHPQCT